MDRSRRALLALLLALPAALGVGLVALGLARLAGGHLIVGLCALAAGAVAVAVAFRWLRSINRRASDGT